MRDIEILAEGDIAFNLESKAQALTARNARRVGVNARMSLLRLTPSDLDDKEKVTEKIEQAINDFKDDLGINLLERNEAVKALEGKPKDDLFDKVFKVDHSPVDVKEVHGRLVSMLEDVDSVIAEGRKALQSSQTDKRSEKDMRNVTKALNSRFVPHEMREFFKQNNVQISVIQKARNDNSLDDGGLTMDKERGIFNVTLSTNIVRDVVNKKKAGTFASFMGSFASKVLQDNDVVVSENPEKEQQEISSKAPKYIDQKGEMFEALLHDFPNRMAAINHWLNEEDKRYRDVEKNLPENTKAYKKMLAELKQLTEKTKERNAGYRQQLDELLDEGKTTETQEPVNSNTQEHSGNIYGNTESAKPEKFTVDKASKTVKDLLEDIEPFLKEMLSETLPKNRFKVDLALEENHPITLTLADENNEAREKMYRTDIKDLDKAVEAKKQLQTIILGRDDILPYRNIAEDRTVTLGSSEMIPEGNPNSAEVTPESGFYKLKLEYLEGDTHIGVTIPLGVSQQDDNKQERAEERADEAMRFIETQQKIGFSITKGDTELYLKGRVAEGKLEGEWKNPERMVVEGFENKTKVNFSDGEVGGQETEIAKISISSKPKLNPTWTADVTILVDGDRVKSFTPDLNTSDHMVAQQRATEYVNELASRIANAQGDNPRGWALDEQGELLKTDAEAGLGSLSVEGIKKLEEQIQRPKVDFSVEPVDNPEEIGDKTRVTLGVFRGARVNAQEQFVNEKTGKMVEKTFVAPDEDTAIEFAVAVDETFKHYLQEAYSTKTESSTGEELTKTGKRYHPMTSVNLFEDAVRSNLAKFDDVEKSHVEARTAEGGAKGIER